MNSPSKLMHKNSHKKNKALGGMQIPSRAMSILTSPCPTLLLRPPSSGLSARGFRQAAVKLKKELRHRGHLLRLSESLDRI